MAVAPLLLWCACGSAADDAAAKAESATGEARPVDFQMDVRPIFARHCFGCHGPDEQQGSLRLDRDRGDDEFQGALDGVIVPAKPEQSELLRRIASNDPSVRMPLEGEPLDDFAVWVIKRWIAEGAEWREHWSLATPERRQPPAAQQAGWVRNPIDAFVLARLQAEGIAPAPETDRRTLLRRVSLDLIGLPPTPAEIDAFVDDGHADAYERVVDRLLASPHFGERWARHWLDVARYADSDGYEQNRDRPFAWRWRDWVIDSINRDQPFDEFTREQIAGDLLPGAGIEQVVATGFHRNSLLNREGGVDLEEDRVKYTVDRVNTVGAVWLGLTLGCAECHNHKYDPIRQPEYYRLYAFFNSIDNRRMKAPLPYEQLGAARARTTLEAARESYVDANRGNTAFREWSNSVAELPDIWVLPESYDLPTFNATLGSNLFLQEDGSFVVTGSVREAKTEDNYTASINTPLESITAIRLEVLSDAMLPGNGPGWNDRGDFSLAEVTVQSSPLSNVTDLRSLNVARVAADYSQPEHEIESALDDNAETAWSIDVPEWPIVGIDRTAVFVLQGDAGYKGGTRLKVQLKQKGGSGLAKIGRFRVTMTSADPSTAFGQAVPDSIREIARIPQSRRSDGQQARLLRYYHATYSPADVTLRDYTEVLAAWERALGNVWAMTVRERQRKRVTRVHHRGDFLSPTGPALQPGTPASLHSLEPRHKLPDRVDLAEWLTDEDNPLTSRVTVNRIWMRLFGEGIVRTPADFGTQGQPPTHPGLLDWLATELLRTGWSRKAIIKIIVTSSTYRQSSAIRRNLQGRDALNRLLARQNRFRLEAEIVRDQFLASSGLLRRSQGGPTVDENTRRRALYIRLKRKQIDPMLTTFDAPDAVTACMRRERSNTPLQALELLNGPLFVDCARALAVRMSRKADATPDLRVELAYRLCLGREPQKSERAALVDLFTDMHALYRSDQEAARQLIGDWDFGPIPSGKAAAWVVVARSILNLDEVVMRP